MNTLSKPLLTTLLSLTVISGCIYAGRTEYRDDVLSGMGAAKYKFIHDRLGDHASQNDVVQEYIDNQHYYDSITY